MWRRVVFILLLSTALVSGQPACADGSQVKCSDDTPIAQEFPFCATGLHLVCANGAPPLANQQPGVQPFNPEPEPPYPPAPPFPPPKPSHPPPPHPPVLPPHLPPRSPPPSPPPPRCPPPLPPPFVPPKLPPPSPPPDNPPPPPFVDDSTRLGWMLPPLGLTVAVCTALSLFLSWLMIRPVFSQAELARHKRDWLRTTTIDALSSKGFETSHFAASQAGVKLVKESTLMCQLLSPEYIPGILARGPEEQPSEDAPGNHARRSMARNLIAAYAELSEHELARMFALAFLNHPGETLRAGVALAVAASRRARELASTDQIKSRHFQELAGTQQLVVAGCLRAIRDADVMEALLSSPGGATAVRYAITGECRVILSLPDVQHVFESRWTGRPAFEETKDLLSIVQRLWSRESGLRLGTTCKLLLTDTPIVRTLLMPLVALWPPLADVKRSALHISPRMRYYSYEASTTLFFLAATLSELPTFRDDRYWPRDYGLAVWALMQLVAQANFIVIGGPTAFITSPENLLEAVANMGFVAGLLLNMCHGHEPINFRFVLWTVSSCSDFPVRVPLAAWEVLSISVLFKGLLLARALRMHPNFGPLILMVLRMAADMFKWAILVAIPVFAFAAALHTLYKDSYDYQTEAASVDDCVDPDTEYETFSKSILLAFEVMLSADGQFECYRLSSKSYVGPALMYAYVMITCIMLVNMARTRAFQPGTSPPLQCSLLDGDATPPPCAQPSGCGSSLRSWPRHSIMCLRHRRCTTSS